jgi:hypothetical protein
MIAPPQSKSIARGTHGVMPTKNITLTLRNALATLIGYPPVMSELLTRRLGG